MPRLILPRHRRVGLLGGSFDPPHEGHLSISMMAMHYLALDELWWLVTPANPLKREASHDFQKRCEMARAITAGHRSIMVSDLEEAWSLDSTFETISFLQERTNGAACVRYVWLMGADCLMEFHHWHHWSRLFRRIALAVFARAPYHHRVTHSVAASHFSYARRPNREARLLLGMKPPAWVYLQTRKNQSSSRIMRMERDD